MPYVRRVSVRKPVVAFVAPGCPHCQSLIEQARALGERYRFLLLPIPAGGQGGAIIRALACAADKPKDHTRLEAENHCAKALPA